MHQISERTNQFNYKLFYIFLFLIFSSLLFYSFSVDKEFSCDGANYFFCLLKSKHTLTIAASRVIADFITQWPIVIAINSGVTNINILKVFFSAGLYFPYILTFIFVMYSSGKSKPIIILLFFISLFCINLTTDFILTGEHHVLCLFCWPILFILLQKERINFLDSIILLFFSFTLILLYETVLTIAVMFSILCVYRIIKYKNNYERLIMFLCIIFYIAAILIAIYYTVLHPRDPVNKSDFLWGCYTSFNNPYQTASVIFTFSFIAYVITKNKYMKLISYLIILFIFILIISGLTYSPGLSFIGRTLSGTFLPVLLVISIYLSFYPKTLNRNSILLYIVFILVISCCNISSTYQWSQFRNLFKIVLKENKGIINSDKTKIKNSMYNWKWTNEQLSLLWSGHEVKTILKDTQGQWKSYNIIKPDKFINKYFRYNIPKQKL